MNYQQALTEYRKDSTIDNLNRLTKSLCDEMTLKEKTMLLHGEYFSFGLRVIFGKLFHGSMFYRPFSGGGCPRLGIPKYNFSDGPRGAVTGHGTCFPVAIMRGASFDVDLEYRIGTAIAREVIAAGANYFAGICINLVRNPRWGRSQESYSEDPYLLGQMGSTLVKAVQAQGVIACPKHYALNSIENLRFQESSNCDERTLREVYLHHFKKCIDAGALSIMGAYNKVNGEYCCENRHLLHDILRKEWGFEGFTMSDFIWGVHDTAGGLKAGLDVEMPVPRFYNYSKIKKYIKKGELDIKDVNRAVRNITGVLIRLTPNIKTQPKKIMKSKAHLDLAEEAALKGMVLLKNKDSLLPISTEAPIAVVGPYANAINTGDKGSSMVVIGKDGITPYAGLKKIFQKVKMYNGLDTQKALSAAAGSEIVIACVGCDAGDEGEFLINIGSKITKKPKHAVGGDRDSLSLNPSHMELLRALKETGKKVIALLYTGSVILTEEIEEYSDAIIMGYYGGIRFGNALAVLVSGEKNFSGKLPLSIAKKEDDYPSFLEIGQTPYEIDYGYYNGYYFFDKQGIEPAYAFGFGLSYTHFEISDIKTVKNDKGGIRVTLSLKNSGDVSGAEVVQVYVGSSGGDEHRPKGMLRGFKRVYLEPGENRIVSINISLEDLKFYHSQKKEWVLDPEYIVYVGNSSMDAAHSSQTVNFT